MTPLARFRAEISKVLKFWPEKSPSAVIVYYCLTVRKPTDSTKINRPGHNIRMY